MRLGIVEMMPGDFRTWTKDHPRAVRDLGFTGFGFHLDGETAFEITPDDCRRYHEFMAGEGLDLALMRADDEEELQAMIENNYPDFEIRSGVSAAEGRPYRLVLGSS